MNQLRSLSNSFYYLFWALLVLSVYLFLRLLNDAGDFDFMNIVRDRILTNFVPVLMGFVVIIVAVWFSQIAKLARVFSQKRKMENPNKYIPSLLWWVPILHWIGPLRTNSALGDNFEYGGFDQSYVNGVKGGFRWFNMAFGVFYTIVIMATIFFFFYENNKDGHDFWYVTQLAFLIVISIAGIRLGGKLRKMPDNSIVA